MANLLNFYKLIYYLWKNKSKQRDYYNNRKPIKIKGYVIADVTFA